MAVATETFVLGGRVYEIQVSPHVDRRIAAVTITLDGQHEWSLAVAGWRELSLGASPETGYFWSARELVILPRHAEAELEVIDIDEDLLTAFRVDRGWLAVCETSVRRLVGDVETARAGFGEVVELATWLGDALVVHDASGEQHTLRVSGGDLIT